MHFQCKPCKLNYIQVIIRLCNSFSDISRPKVLVVSSSQALSLILSSSSQWCTDWSTFFLFIHDIVYHLMWFFLLYLKKSCLWSHRYCAACRLTTIMLIFSRYCLYTHCFTNNLVEKFDIFYISINFSFYALKCIWAVMHFLGLHRCRFPWGRSNTHPTYR